MIAGLAALAGTLERRSGLLAIAKLANVALAMLWGFVVTFVFVRLLPMDEFRAFLLLVAFANFTVSEELGISAIAYSRLRRDRVSGEGSFRAEEIVALLWLLGGIILLGALLILAAIGSGLLKTDYPGLFIAFYGVAAINLLTLLARRTLAALDHNLWWEALDFIRRVSGIGLLLAALIGLPLMASVLLQLGLALAILWAGLATVQSSLGMATAHWWGAKAGAAHIRAHYLADFGRTGVLTLCDVAAYNAPYFTIAAATPDPRPLLLFDFAFKFSRALSAIIRALAETVLPGLTRAAYGGDGLAVRKAIRRCMVWALGATSTAAAAVLLLGGWVANIIFDGNLILQSTEINMIAGLLFGLCLICVSVYLQWGLGRFAALVRPSMLLLAGSLLSVPLAVFAAQTLGWSLSLAFITIYAGVHLVLGLLHGRLLANLVRGRGE